MLPTNQLVQYLPTSSRYLSGDAVNFRQDSSLRGGAAVVLVDLDGWHYVVLSGDTE